MRFRARSRHSRPDTSNASEHALAMLASAVSLMNTRVAIIPQIEMATVTSAAIRTNDTRWRRAEARTRGNVCTASRGRGEVSSQSHTRQAYR